MLHKNIILLSWKERSKKNCTYFSQTFFFKESKKIIYCSRKIYRKDIKQHTHFWINLWLNRKLILAFFQFLKLSSRRLFNQRRNFRSKIKGFKLKLSNEKFKEIIDLKKTLPIDFPILTQKHYLRNSSDWKVQKFLLQVLLKLKKYRFKIHNRKK